MRRTLTRFDARAFRLALHAVSAQFTTVQRPGGGNQPRRRPSHYGPAKNLTGGRALTVRRELDEALSIFRQIGAASRRHLTKAEEEQFMERYRRAAMLLNHDHFRVASVPQLFSILGVASRIRQHSSHIAHYASKYLVDAAPRLDAVSLCRGAAHMLAFEDAALAPTAEALIRACIAREAVEVAAISRPLVCRVVRALVRATVDVSCTAAFLQCVLTQWASEDISAFDVRHTATICTAIVELKITTIDALKYCLVTSKKCVEYLDLLSPSDACRIALAFALMGFRNGVWFIAIGEHVARHAEEIDDHDAGRILHALSLTTVEHDGLRAVLESSLRFRSLTRRPLTHTV